MERRRTRQPPRRPLVLLADSQVDTRELYAKTLRSFDFETTMVGDGEDVYVEAWRTHPDIIVTELWLPRPDGWNFIRDIKHDPRTRDIPVVILTGDGQAHARERADQEGCSAFVVKPCLPEDLALTLREVLTRAHADDHAPLSH